MGLRLPQQQPAQPALLTPEFEQQTMAKGFNEKAYEDLRGGLRKSAEPYDVDEDLRFLKVAGQNMEDPDIVKALETYGIEQEDLKAFTISDQLPVKEKLAIQNHVLDRIADYRLETFGPVQKQHEELSIGSRRMISLLLDRSPEDQLKFLNKLGFNAKYDQGQLVIRKPGETNTYVVNPNDFELEDVIGLGDDIAQTLLEFAGGAIGTATSGPGVGTAVGVVGASGVADILRQGIANVLGAKEGYDPMQTIKEMGWSAAGESVVPGLKTLARTAAKPISKMMGVEKKRTFDVTMGAIDKLNKYIQETGASKQRYKPTRSQLFKDRRIKDIEESLAQISTAGSKEFRDRLKDNRQAITDVIDFITKDIKEVSLGQTGVQFKKDVIEQAEKDLFYAKSLYKYLDNVAGKTPLSAVDIEDLGRSLSGIINTEVLDSASESTIKRIINQSKKITSLHDLEKLDDLLSKELVAQTKGTASAANYDVFIKVGDAINDARLKAVNNLQQIGLDQKSINDIQKAMKMADGQYKKSVDIIERSILPRKTIKKAGKGVIKTLEKEMDFPSEAAINKYLKNNDFERVANLKQDFPKAFETLTKGKFSDVLNKSMVQGELDPNAFIREMRKAGPEVRKMMLGSAHEAFEALSELYNVKLAPGNPSRTAITQKILDGFKGILPELKLALLGPLPVNSTVFEPPSAVKKAIISFLRQKGITVDSLPDSPEQFEDLRRDLTQERLKPLEKQQADLRKRFLRGK